MQILTNSSLELKDNRADFSLDGSNLLTKRPFDYEEEKSFTVAVQVTDSGGEKIVDNVAVTVENEKEKPVLVSPKKLPLTTRKMLGK